VCVSQQRLIVDSSGRGRGGQANPHSLATPLFFVFACHLNQDAHGKLNMKLPHFIVLRQQCCGAKHTHKRSLFTRPIKNHVNVV